MLPLDLCVTWSPGSDAGACLSFSTLTLVCLSYSRHKWCQRMTLVINCFLQLNIAYLSSILTTPYVDTPIQPLFCMKSLISNVLSQLIATCSHFSPTSRCSSSVLHLSGEGHAQHFNFLVWYMISSGIIFHITISSFIMISMLARWLLSYSTATIVHILIRSKHFHSLNRGQCTSVTKMLNYAIHGSYH